MQPAAFHEQLVRALADVGAIDARDVDALLLETWKKTPEETVKHARISTILGSLPPKVFLEVARRVGFVPQGFEMSEQHPPAPPFVPAPAWSRAPDALVSPRTLRRRLRQRARAGWPS